MLLHVWPGLNFWFCLAIIWSPSWVVSFLAMKFIKKTTGLVTISLISMLAFSWSASIVVLWKFYFLLRRNRDTNRFFSGYESAGKTIGFALLFFGNVGLYYFSEKSVACMLTFLFLAFYCLCFLLCIQPYTDFGALEFFLSGSLNQTLHVFGLRSPYSWLVIIACIVIAGIRYRLEPAHPPGQATCDEVEEVQLEAGLLTKAREDAIQLHRAFEGWGCDAPTIVKILAHRSATQRALIRREYKTKFSEDLDNRLSKELRLSADLKRAVLLWMHDPATRDAVRVRQGLTDNLTLKLNVAIEVICSRTPSQIERLKKVYRPLFGSYLEQDIESHASGDNKKFLLAYVGKSRSEGPEVNKMMVDRDAKALFKDGEYKLGTNEETFIRIFSERSWAHLAAVGAAYRSMFVNSLKKLLLTYVGKSRSEGPEEDATMVDRDAKALFKDGEYKLGTNEETFIRIFSERSWAHLAAVGAAYRSMFVNSLKKAIKNETSLNFKCALLTILQCAENPAKYFAKVLHKAIDGLGTDEKTLSRIIVSRAEIDIQQIKAEYLKKYKKSLSDEVHSVTSGNYRAFLLSLLDW
ncbi:hypothetical protein Vadar_001141 [Vaccinium darrowii]|uniref:Uncharacterized protein n=1 Tax=Vaccinium darrowii TaxID=229202 RepID=A0ACB7YC02_9ERIC|nr:hypothetical protein Vadar_001141 [Vaccinium darrowii]